MDKKAVVEAHVSRGKFPALCWEKNVNLDSLEWVRGRVLLYPCHPTTKVT